VTFISDIGIGYRVRPHVDIGYRHFPKFTYWSDTSKKFSITQWSKPDNTEDDSAFLPENSLVDSTGIAVLDTTLHELCNILSSQSCTARLWMQYLCNIEIMKAFLAAERTSNQEMHLRAFQAMLPVFAAAHHINCAISGPVYLQQMQNLPSTHTWLHKQSGE